jgi:hypothetical protein
MAQRADRTTGGVKLTPDRLRNGNALSGFQPNAAVEGR